MKYNDERSRYRAPARSRYAGLTQRVCDRDYGNPNLPRAPAPVAAAATAAPALPFHAGKPATTVAEWRSCRLTAFSGAAPMAAFGGAHHQAGFQQMATGFPGVVAGGFIQGGAPKVLLVNNLCEGVSRCFTLWPQCCLTDGWIFQVTCNQIFTLCGVRPTPLRNGGDHSSCRHSRPLRNRPSVLWCRFPDSGRSDGENSEKTENNV